MPMIFGVKMPVQKKTLLSHNGYKNEALSTTCLLTHVVIRLVILPVYVISIDIDMTVLTSCYHPKY